MTQGLLEVRGTIPLAQFWPEGESDADTTKVKIEVGVDSFSFRPNPGAQFRSTQAFEGARVKGRVTKPVIDDKRRVTIRLQGIDAPELHYTPQAAVKKADRTQQQHDLYLKWNLKYRQPFAESATVALATLLAKPGIDPLPCRVFTAVDQPDDAIDAYGRLVGDILVMIEGNETNLNRWLATRGWAIPALYNSMSGDEINTLIDAGRQAEMNGAGVWPQLAKVVGRLDFDLVYRKSVAEGEEEDDSGLVLMPKLFRRLSAWAVNRRAKMVTGGFTTYLKNQRDICYVTEDFLEQGPTAATPRGLAEFIGTGGKLQARPQGLVFHEAAATLVAPGGGTPTW